MNLKKVFTIWLLVTIIILFEYWALNYSPKFSWLFWLQSHAGLFTGKKLITSTGKFISYWLGWFGFTLILLTNPYIIRKRFFPLSHWGKLPRWLAFHITCGLIGPTLIIFHSDFKIGGLVAISFWSMMIVAVSGVMGSYFYLQVSSKKEELNKEIKYWEKKLIELRDKYAKHITDESLEKIKLKALVYVGANVTSVDASFWELPGIFLHSFICDLKLFLSDPKTLAGLPPKSRIVLGSYGLAHRKILLTVPFQRLLGHWHTFHVPFTIMMYIAAVLHIIAALMFGV